jgi:lysophospholipase L1-like esterase
MVWVPQQTGELTGKKIGFFGSSSSDDLYVNVKKYYRFIQDRTGIIPVPKAVAGSQLTSAYANYTSDTASHCQLLQIDQFDGTQDGVIGLIGANDELNAAPMGTWSDVVDNTFYGALHHMCKKLYDKFPGKRIGIMTSQYYTPNTAQSSSYQANIKAVCAFYGIPVLDLHSEGQVPYSYSSFKSTYVLADGLHLTDAGNEIMSYRVESFLRQLFGH